MGVVCFVLQLLWCLRWAHPLPGGGNAHSWACSQAQCAWPCESHCGPASPRPAAARPTLPAAPARGADPPACSSPSVPLAPPAPLPCPMPVPGMLPAADSKSVTWTRGSFVAQAVSFFSLTVPAVLRGLQPLQGLPRWPAPPPRSEPQGTSGQAHRSCRVQSVLGRTKVMGGEAGSRLLPPRPRAAFCLHAPELPSASTPLLTSCSPRRGWAGGILWPLVQPLAPSSPTVCLSEAYTAFP